MRRLLLLLIAGAVLAAAAAADEHEDEADEGDAVSTVDVLAVLEEINQKLDHAKPISTDRASDAGFGGGPFLPVRYLPGVAGLNDYFKQLGSYPALSALFIPLKNGGGGTWRWSVNGNLQFGMEYSGFGQEVIGRARHAPAALGPRDTVDADGDGLDDYYSDVKYGQHYFAGIAQYKWALAPSVYLQTGIKTGLGWEALRYHLNRRSVLTGESHHWTLGIDSGANSWSRTTLVGSAYAGIQIALDGDRNVFKLGLEVGADGHLPVSEWRPGTGVHQGVPAPPASLQAHNFWVAIGPQFHY